MPVKTEKMECFLEKHIHYCENNRTLVNQRYFLDIFDDTNRQK